MFDKRKKKQALKLQEERAARAALEKHFADSIAEAERMINPANRVLRLEGIRNEIRPHILSTSKSMSKEVDAALTKAMVGGTGATAAITAAVGIATGGIGALIVYPLLAVTAGWGDHRERKVRAAQESEIVPHLKKLAELHDRAYALRNEIAVNNVAAVRSSPFYKRILDMPDLKEQFTAAAAKEDELQIQRAKEALERREAAKNQPPEPPREKKPIGGFENIRKFGQPKK